MNPGQSNDTRLDQLQKRAWIVGGAALAVCLAGWLINPEQFFHSYLLGFLLWIGVALGSASLLMIHHLAGGDWGFVIRRCLESSLRTIPLLFVLMLPLLLGLQELYIWARPDVVQADAILQHKSAYLNIPFFLARTAVYFIIWGLFAYFLSKLSAEQDRTGEPRIKRKLEVISGPGLAVMGLTITFSAVDWVMSLDPHWFSTLFGFIFMVGNVLTTLAVMICALAYLRDREPLKVLLKPSHFHDLGNLLMAFVILWAYMALSQYLIIWSGNLPEEITWYIDRTATGWVVIGIILVVFHFAVPFLVLLSRQTKRSVESLVRVAVLLLVMRLMDLLWTVAPTLHHEQFHLSWMDLAAPVGIGGLWLAGFVRALKEQPLLPLRDPQRAAIEHAGGHS
jgi:Ni/Fe-hydrogenase subunit HybB-like protein